MFSIFSSYFDQNNCLKITNFFYPKRCAMLWNLWKENLILRYKKKWFDTSPEITTSVVDVLITCHRGDPRTGYQSYIIQRTFNMQSWLVDTVHNVRHREWPSSFFFSPALQGNFSLLFRSLIITICMNNFPLKLNEIKT